MTDRKPIAVFDMDGVLIRQRSSWRIVHEAVGTSNEHSFQAYIREEIDDEEFMKRDIALWMNKGILTISQIGELLDRAEPMEGFDPCLRDLKDNGVELAILSGGIDILARRLGERGGIDKIFANGIETDNEGGLTGKGILRVPLRDKGGILASLLKENEKYGPVVVIGDSPVDISMFGSADLSIAFRPDSGIVAEKADIIVNDPNLEMVSNIILEYLKGRDGGTD